MATLLPLEFIGDRTYRRVVVPRDALSAIAAFPAVLWIDVYHPGAPSGQRETHLTLGSTLTTSTGTLGPVPGNHRQWISDHALGNYKSIMKIGTVDTGFDIGSVTDVHRDFRNAAGISFVQVVRYSNAIGSDADCNGHGTMVAGVLAGNAGIPAATQTKDLGSLHGDADYYMGLGIVPEMPLVVGRIFNYLGAGLCDEPPLCFDPQPFHVIYSDLYNRGARIVNSSWNDSVNPNYTGESPSYRGSSQIHDRLVRSVTGEDGGPPMTIYVSSGNNENFVQDYVSSPATAKNVISVGGSENVNPNTYPEVSGVSPSATKGPDADNGNDWWRVTQIGPTEGDHRIKPDLLAPASAIESPRTRSVAACRRLPAAVGIDDDATDGQVSPVGEQHYWSRGTSFAAPLAAGAGALLYTWFRNTYGVDPKPALVKAMQISLARELTGTFLNHPPDPYQGWGKVDLTRLFDPPPAFVVRNEEQSEILTNGQLLRLPAGSRYQIKDLGKPVKVTLAWTDAAGTPGAQKALANDLDLTVNFYITGGPVKFALGNDFNPAGHTNVRTVTGTGTPDTVNNVEQVVFTYVDSGADQFFVDVLGKSIVADGINVWNGTVPQQNFALFLENVITVPPGATRFNTLTPCRIVDTRNAQGPYGGPYLSGAQARSFMIRGQCGVPLTAKGVSVNLTAIPEGGDGYLTAYPSDPPPNVSTLNYRNGVVRANNATLAMDSSGNVRVVASVGPTHLLLDVSGYFE